MNKVIYEKTSGKVLSVLPITTKEVSHYFAKDLIEEKEDGTKIYGEEKEIKDYHLGNYDKETIREEKRIEEFPKLYFNNETCAVAETEENPTFNKDTHYLIYKDGEFKTKCVFSYERLVEKYIREKYSVSQELAILRQREEKKEEFNEYYDFAESCKQLAKEIIK
jgi:hypothetical protein